MTHDLPARIQARIRAGLPARPARERFSPELSYGRHFGPGLATTMNASVMVLLCPLANGWHIPLTRRPPEMKYHAGQISLPGGAAGADESPEETAIRELREELGVAGKPLRILGLLSEAYLFVSDFRVVPVLAWWDGPWRPRPDSREVSELLMMPLEALVDPRNHGCAEIRAGQAVDAESDVERDTSTGFRTYAPAIRWNRLVIWGATAIVLGELIEILNDVTI